MPRQRMPNRVIKDKLTSLKVYLEYEVLEKLKEPKANALEREQLTMQLTQPALKRYEQDMEAIGGEKGHTQKGVVRLLGELLPLKAEITKIQTACLKARGKTTSDVVKREAGKLIEASGKKIEEEQTIAGEKIVRERISKELQGEISSKIRAIDNSIDKLRGTTPNSTAGKTAVSQMIEKLVNAEDALKVSINKLIAKGLPKVDANKTQFTDSLTKARDEFSRTCNDVISTARKDLKDDLTSRQKFVNAVKVIGNILIALVNLVAKAADVVAPKEAVRSGFSFFKHEESQAALAAKTAEKELGGDSPAPEESGAKPV